jgi:hypothetical protein
MRRYPERPDEFAEGWRFARMRRPIQNRADILHDTRASVEARLVFGITEEQTKRAYFGGEDCLQELAARVVVTRGFGNDCAESAYANRYGRRTDALARLPQKLDVGEEASLRVTI